MLKKLQEIKERYKQVTLSLSQPDALKDMDRYRDLAKEERVLSEIVKKTEEYESTLASIEDDKKIIQESSDEELLEIAEIELHELEEQFNALEEELKILLLPKDENDEKNAIVEIRAGTGGDEAGLFAGDLFRMYTRYIERHGWKQETLSSNPQGIGGFKEVVFQVNGENVFGSLKFESGVHRVQRVPKTESSGRIHTSAASVAVLPEAEEVDVAIAPNDLRIDVYRSSGPGGQSVNTTDSAVRITHVPTGMVVTCQDEKSQHKNKAKALRVLRARLYEKKMEEEQAKLTASRRSMVGSGDRSAKIRTFNFPQNRVTDHRINLTLYKLEEILAGDLDELINQLQIAERTEKLKGNSSPS